MISVIIVTRNDETNLALALAALVPAATEGLVRDVIVVDRGSEDGTAIVADAAGCRFIADGPGGDGRRLAVEEARSDWLLFLHPAAMLEAGWASEALGFIDAAINSGSARQRVACFRLGRMEPGFRARLDEFFATCRTRVLAAPHAEQGLLISRAFYRSLGGHRDLPAFADVDLARRVGRRHLWLLRARAVVRTAPDELGFARSLRNAACLLLLVLRAPPGLIGRLAA